MKLDPEVVQLQSSFRKIQTLIPPGANPFDYALNHMLKFKRVEPSRLTLIALKAFFGFHVVISFFCFFILLLPVFRHNRDQQWIVKRLYIGNPSDKNEKAHPTPLWLLNSGPLMASCQLIGSISTLFYLRLLIVQNFTSGVFFFILLGLIFEFEFFAYWILAWGSLYTWLYTGTSYAIRLKRNPRRTISPFMLNFIFIGFPVLATVVTSISVYLQVNSTERELEQFRGLTSEIRSLSLIWKSSKTENPALDPNITQDLMKGVIKLEEMSTQMMLSLQAIISAFRSTCASWAPVMFVTAMLFIFSLSNLLLLALQKAEQKSPILSRETASGSSTQKNSSIKNSTSRNKRITRKRYDRMKRSIYYLAFRGAMAFIAISATTIYCLLGIARAGTIVINESWRSSMSWFSLLSGLTMAIPITLQCWRMYRDKGQLPNASLGSQSNSSASSSRGRNLRGASVHISITTNPAFVFAAESSPVTDSIPLEGITADPEKSCPESHSLS